MPLITGERPVVFEPIVVIKSVSRPASSDVPGQGVRSQELSATGKPLVDTEQHPSVFRPRAAVMEENRAGRTLRRQIVSLCGRAARDHGCLQTTDISVEIIVVDTQ